MVAMGTARMTPAAPDPAEVVRAELVEALADLVSRVVQHGKADAQSALCYIDVVRAVLAAAAMVAPELKTSSSTAAGREDGFGRPAATRSEVKRCGPARLNMRRSGMFPLE